MSEPVGTQHKLRMHFLAMYFILFACTGMQSITAKETVVFSGGYTKAVMREGIRTILLSQGARVEASGIVFTADSIELSGTDFSLVSAQGSVQLTHQDQGLSISSPVMVYDRSMKTLVIDSWVELMDLHNEVIASGGYLMYQEDTGIMQLQISARLLHHTESGAMVCRAESIEFNRTKRTLALSGNSSVYWKGDTYEASVIIVDLETEELSMEGSIKGTIHG